MKLEVREQRAVEIDRLAKEHFLPKIGYDGNVLVEIQIDKMMADLFIGDRGLIELP